MNDPDSYEHVEIKYWDMKDHLIINTILKRIKSAKIQCSRTPYPNSSITFCNFALVTFAGSN